MQIKKTLDKQKKQLYKKWLSCKKTKCSSITNKKAKANKIFEKEQDRECPGIKNDMKYYNCTSKFWDKSTTYLNIVNEEKKCGDEKCSKEHHEYKNTFNANSKGGMRKTNTKNKIKQKITGENLQKELEDCKKKHCNDITKQFNKEYNEYMKQLNTECKVNNNDYNTYNKCQKIVYDNSTYKKTSMKSQNCMKTNCSKKMKNIGNFIKKTYNNKYK